jgi:4-alpha-glucanotransferase
MEFMRASGILLHPTSLPGRYGIGDLGDAAYRFVDFLKAAGQQLWQIMPLGPTSYGDSPYQALSAMAGNPLLISLDRLAEDRLLASWDLEKTPQFSDSAVDFGAVIDFKSRLLWLSFANFQANAGAAQRAEFAGFVDEHQSWLTDYALFASLKAAHGGANWSTWEPELATRRPAALDQSRKSLAEEIRYHEYVQWQFARQWSTLKAYANQQGIRIIGDIPIFVAYDSADAWAHPELFYFDAEGHPTAVAGVPPDYFSPTGQLWGNPLYRWDVMADTGYAWWIERFRATFEQVDIVRLDHFRGFASYWAVPATEKTAVKGRWEAGPGTALFDAVAQALGPRPIIAEDLGLITPRVRKLLAALDLPGMRVLQFAFSGDPDNLYLPHNHTCNSVVYTGTHDNNTTLGWFKSAGQAERTAVQRYLNSPGYEINWELIRLALMSVAHSAIFPLQDVLGIGSEGRMNTPGRATGNWGWRYREGMLTTTARDRLKLLTEIYGRLPRSAETASGATDDDIPEGA